MFIGADRLSNSPSRTDLLQRPNFLDGDCTTMYSKDTWNVSYCACVYLTLQCFGSLVQMLDFVIFASTVVIGLLIILIFCWVGDGKVREEG